MSGRESAACERAVAAVLAGMTTPHAREVHGVALSTITRALRRRGVAPMTPRPRDVESLAIWVPRSTPPDAQARVQALATHLGAVLRRGSRVRVVGLDADIERAVRAALGPARTP